jgi:hypothetical protein
MTMQWPELFQLCESPIEEEMAMGLSRWPDCEPHPAPCTPSLFRHAETGGKRLLFAQHPIGRFRADFLLVAASCQPLVIECDGLEWHSGQEMWTRDFDRDQEMRRLGYNIVRFGGWRIRRELAECLRITDLALRGALP